MPPFAVEVHPLAADEAEAAERWYRERNETAATRFRRELDRAVGLIAERPEAAPPSATPDAFCGVGSLSSSSTECSASVSK
jgi:plasmid stabilization system protein ParE